MRRLSITAGKPRPSHTLAMASGVTGALQADRPTVAIDVTGPVHGDITTDVTTDVAADLVLDVRSDEPVAVG